MKQNFNNILSCLMAKQGVIISRKVIENVLDNLLCYFHFLDYQFSQLHSPWKYIAMILDFPFGFFKEKLNEILLIIKIMSQF